MIILDTNLVSEAMKPEPQLAVRAWLDAQAAETLFLSSVTLAELLFGIGGSSDGQTQERFDDGIGRPVGAFRRTRSCV